jgi:hypothetical protein
MFAHHCLLTEKRVTTPLHLSRKNIYISSIRWHAFISYMWVWYCTAKPLNPGWTYETRCIVYFVGLSVVSCLSTVHGTNNVKKTLSSLATIFLLWKVVFFLCPRFFTTITIRSIFYMAARFMFLLIGDNGRWLKAQLFTILVFALDVTWYCQ